MGNSGRTSDAIAALDEDDFDPFLGLVLGTTWWKLGKNFSPALTAENESARQAYLEKWSKELREYLKQEKMTESIDAISPDTVWHFIENAMMLLEKKYRSEKIAKEVIKLTKKTSVAHVYDQEHYIDIQEPNEVFWASEYDFLFSALTKPLTGGKGWLHAVARCSDPDCTVFFIKQRKDQRYHTDACRTRTGNREAYKKERPTTRAHTQRGRPRLNRLLKK